MGALFAILTRSAVRLVATLGVVILILLAGHWLKSEWANLDVSTVTLAQLQGARDEIKVQQPSLQRSLLKRVPDPGAPIRAVSEQRKRFEGELRGVDEQIRRIERESKFTFRIPGSPAFIDLVRAKAERALLQEATDYTVQLHELLLSTQACRIQLLNADARMLAVRADIYKKLQDLEEVNRSGGISLLSPFSDASRRRDAIEADLKRLTGEQTVATTQYDDKLKDCAQAKPKKPFTIDWGPIDQALQPLEHAIEELERKVETNAIGKFMQPIVKVLPVALWIVFGIFIAPIVIKVFAYFVVAPLAARCRPLRLLPRTSGQVEVGNGRSRAAVSQSLVLGPDEELLVHGDYVQSAAVATRKDTRWLLDWSMPLTSLAAGLYGLMRFSGESSEPVVLSSSSDPLQELAVLVLPAGAALVLQPRCLVGLVRRRSEKLGITRHWRLGYLSSWVTLQLRYIVFHGPVTLVLRGCRGVRVEPVSEGRLINQAATLGFSANVAYSTGRCETFGSYLLGQQDLFNDRFSGASGVYIYEETPRRDIKGGITGRGIEGVLDSLLKVVGI